jgi:acetylglutamate kinase
MTGVTVIKIGGALLEKPDAAVARILAVGASTFIVVHGGGIQISRMLEKMNVKSEFIDGLRVTDDIALGAVAAALLGEVQTGLVAALQKAGIPAVGIFGAIRAEKKAGPWGLVGTNVQADSTSLTRLLENGHVPVVPTLAIGNSSLLNVNGDETAAAVALGLKAQRLIFLTDVEGVMDADRTVIAHVPRELSLRDAPFVSGGMKPKLRAVEAALAGGVSSVSVGRTVFGDLQ